MSQLPPEIRALSVGDRLELVTELWNSIAEDTPAPPLTEEQRSLLDARLAERENRDDQSQPWSAVKPGLTGA